MLEVGEEPWQRDEDRHGRWCSRAKGDGAAHTTGGRCTVTAEWTAGRGATARRGDAAAVGKSGRRQEDLGAAAGTASRDIAA